MQRGRDCESLSLKWNVFLKTLSSRLRCLHRRKGRKSLRASSGGWLQGKPVSQCGIDSLGVCACVLFVLFCFVWVSFVLLVFFFSGFFFVFLICIFWFWFFYFSCFVFLVWEKKKKNMKLREERDGRLKLEEGKEYKQNIFVWNEVLCWKDFLSSLKYLKYWKAWIIESNIP